MILNRTKDVTVEGLLGVQVGHLILQNIEHITVNFISLGGYFRWEKSSLGQS